jgi:tetratricopeptide (TPR) repeat protein
MNTIERQERTKLIDSLHRLGPIIGLCLLPTMLPAQGGPESLGDLAGEIEFPTSCDAAVAGEINRAVELLHSFEYPESEKTFRAILDRAPDCAMARWGVAMNLWHPLWELPSEAALQIGSAMLEGIDLSAVTPREAGYIDALRLFYADDRNLSHQTRARTYRDRMSQVYIDNLDDLEAAVFYALSLLATADPADKTYANQFKAAGLLNWVRNSKPHHPGVLHYLIHSYDYPGMAHLALPAATIYADVAPDSAHAQHMPSHIFTRLGLWDRSISSNYDSTASAEDYTRRANLPGHYDEGLHSIDYLMYALLQAARDDEAAQLLERLRGIGKAHLDNFKVAFTYASAPARYASERRQWAEASQLTLFPVDFPWQEFEWARSIHHFARGIGAARSSELDLARQELGVIEDIAAGLSDTALPYWREQVFVHADALSSWIAHAEGDSEMALRLAEAAADREDAVDKDPVTPGEVLPARELLADMLLELGRYSDALEQYRTVLARSPNRTNALLGAARAAAESGAAGAAVEYYEAVIDQTSAGNPGREGLSEAREYIADR